MMIEHKGNKIRNKEELPVTTIIYTALLLIAILHLVSSLPSLYHAYDAYQLADRVYQLNDINDDLYAAVDSLGFERGRVNVVLNDAGSPERMEENRQFIAKQRSEADIALSRALTKLDAIGMEKVRPQTAAIQQHKEMIDRLRKETATDMLIPKSSRNEQLTKVWFSAMSRYIEEIEALLLTISSDISDADGMIARYSSLKHIALSLRNSAGPEISILSGVMLSQVPVTAEQTKKIEQQQITSLVHFKNLELLSKPLQNSPIPDALKTLKTHYSTNYLPYRDATFRAALTGGPYPYEQPDFLKRGVMALNQISEFNKVLISTTKRYAMQHRSILVRQMFVQLFSSTTSLLIIILIFWLTLLPMNFSTDS